MWKMELRKFLITQGVLQQFCDSLKSSELINSRRERVGSIINSISYSSSKQTFPVPERWSVYSQLWREYSIKIGLIDRDAPIVLDLKERKALAEELLKGNTIQLLYKHLKAIQKES